MHLTEGEFRGGCENRAVKMLLERVKNLALFFTPFSGPCIIYYANMQGKLGNGNAYYTFISFFRFRYMD